MSKNSVSTWQIIKSSKVLRIMYLILFILWVLLGPLFAGSIKYSYFPTEGDVLGGLEIILIPFYWALLAIVYFVPYITSKIFKINKPHVVGIVQITIVSLIAMISEII